MSKRIRRASVLVWTLGILWGCGNNATDVASEATDPDNGARAQADRDDTRDSADNDGAPSGDDGPQDANSGAGAAGEGASPTPDDASGLFDSFFGAGTPAEDATACEDCDGLCLFGFCLGGTGNAEGDDDDGGAGAGDVDAGMSDTGQVDAGQVDAGQVDAGQVDAGQVDAGQVDAGMHDAASAAAGDGLNPSHDADVGTGEQTGDAEEGSAGDTTGDDGCPEGEGCPEPEATCGDATCDDEEDALSCPDDCPDRCGDGLLTGDEECDDGNTVTEPCPYGDPECDVCAEDCQWVNLSVYCGDGQVTDEEQCDDGNDIEDDGCTTECLFEE